ncbi:MAG: metallophosphoesterase family protein [Candidatus Coatesbacteria bacterium]|nr:metallophosphoesterase family protein [Candidatus Coatesbacteria bacterium]
MIFALISDIHANLHALEVVLDKLDSDKISQIYSLGDLIGYGAYPNECIEIIKYRNIPTILGNHDSVGAKIEDIRFFNRFAKESIIWTQMTLLKENRKFLESLTYYNSSLESLLVHSSPYNPSRWHYILTIQEAMIQFQYFREKICFFGHSHLPVIIDSNGEIYYPKNYPFIFKMEDNKRYLVNVGSVGQPRDKDPRACYLKFDTTQNCIEYHRAEYDIESAQKAIRKISRADLSEETASYLSNRLIRGE